MIKVEFKIPKALLLLFLFDFFHRLRYYFRDLGFLAFLKTIKHSVLSPEIYVEEIILTFARYFLFEEERKGTE